MNFKAAFLPSFKTVLKREGPSAAEAFFNRGSIGSLERMLPAGRP